ncbi:winged helix-turn-helix transcriptional regulator [Chitinophaga sp. Ak27]|uniref:winged helix-turn-helix transcriptional regulator n=1 Tax=Chitinophaga sp. Ak27 TaxID=2726116 RepID=UPI00145E4583|nr:helix-turn-helix domain-containing protein [Chitinophaga sp. Ak27]NLU90503.1 helix-turn-helix transcriptional regulator [Chitinophaga sp. Ak27]
MESQLYKGCPVQFTLQFLAGKWRTGILWNLREKSMRFGDLKRTLPGVTDKVLMNELQFLTSRGMIGKEEFREFPPRTEYSLSPTGSSLLPIIRQIIIWGYDHLQDEKINEKMFMTPAGIIEDVASLANKPQV